MRLLNTATVCMKGKQSGIKSQTETEGEADREST